MLGLYDHLPPGTVAKNIVDLTALLKIKSWKGLLT